MAACSCSSPRPGSFPVEGPGQGPTPGLSGLVWGQENQSHTGPPGATPTRHHTAGHTAEAPEESTGTSEDLLRPRSYASGSRTFSTRADEAAVCLSPAKRRDAGRLSPLSQGRVPHTGRTLRWHLGDTRISGRAACDLPKRVRGMQGVPFALGMQQTAWGDGPPLTRCHQPAWSPPVGGFSRVL